MVDSSSVLCSWCRRARSPMLRQHLETRRFCAVVVATAMFALAVGAAETQLESSLRQPAAVLSGYSADAATSPSISVAGGEKTDIRIGAGTLASTRVVVQTDAVHRRYNRSGASADVSFWTSEDFGDRSETGVTACDESQYGCMPIARRLAEDSGDIDPKAFNRNMFVKRICEDCKCRLLDEIPCFSSDVCDWRRTESVCTMDIWVATPEPVMLQCEPPPSGRCKSCSAFNDSSQCGYTWYQEQRVNCTWNSERNACFPKEGLAVADKNKLVGAPKADYNLAVADFEATCNALLDKRNCTANPDCRWLAKASGARCHFSIESMTAQSFWSGLGYTQAWMLKAGNCSHHIGMTQTQCLQAGCDWIVDPFPGHCGMSVSTECALQCNETNVAKRMQFAFLRTLDTQCGEPCDESESFLNIGTGGEKYDVVDRLRAEGVCGASCEARSDCAGFNMIASLGRCYYRRSTTCYVRRNNDRDCYTKKARCASLVCPAGYLPIPGEENTFCRDLICDVRTDRDICCVLAVCVDTNMWRSEPGCSEDSFTLAQGCANNAWTCEAYKIWSWCIPSPVGIMRGVPVAGAEWALGNAHNFPETHCCICGGGEEMLPTIDLLAEPPPLHRIAEVPPLQHVCCVKTGPRIVDVVGILPQALNHTDVQRIACANGGFSATTKVGAVCSYCLCLETDGADLFNDPSCCSIREFGKAGIDPTSGHPYCNRYSPKYNLDNHTLRSCELRYDLYRFAVNNAEVLPRLDVALRVIWVAAVFPMFVQAALVAFGSVAPGC
eukprot:TRINITY_DN16147_c0_g2_i1.p1 TRINITY_DN16147_c0_g2~~TRINITY_DN16147_c0_g2_i1.p1  ORF type:complete len:780 (-),score=92.53 TRINITY_DN16147_c0_g2_i1:53-2392(-)